jgi:hypothetical protein
MVNLKFNSDFKSHIKMIVLSLLLFLLVGNFKLFLLIKVLALTAPD